MTEVITVVNWLLYEGNKEIKSLQSGRKVMGGIE